MTDPLVSIVILTYRRPRLLRQALASAVGQTYKNLQIIVRDNASGDETPEAVRSFGDPRVEFLQSPITVPMTENHAEAYKRARGRYVLMLCDDDILSANYVETLLRYLQQDNTILAAYGATSVIDENGAVTRTHIPDGTYTRRGKEIVQSWCDGTLPIFSGISYLCPKDFLMGVSILFSKLPEGHNADNALFLAAAIQGKILFTNRCMFYYRDWGLNSWKQWSCRMHAQGDRELLKFLDNQVRSDRNVSLPKVEWPGLRAELRAHISRAYFAHFLRFRLDKDGMREMARDFTVYPIRTYGIRNTLACLCRNRRELQKISPTWLRKSLQICERIARWGIK